MTHRSRSIVIHAHFYQPPRENPFFDEIEAEASAAPFHDWNERIERECYRAVVAARVTGRGGRIARIVNTLERVSFNVGPTLFEWMERHAPDTCHAIAAADRASARRLDGHGNAIAQAYHHVILPLASRRDKTTEVRWGIADFRRRFGREPEGMWLPETAVDDETLDVLAAEGIRFTIVAPHQVRERPPNGLPGRYRTSNGRTIDLCIYDGDLSHGIAFGGLVRDGRRFAEAMLGNGGWGMGNEGTGAGIREPGTGAGRGKREAGSGVVGVRDAAGVRDAGVRDAGVRDAAGVRDEGRAEFSPLLVSAATDGETYGHHHKFAEMALARALEIVEENSARIENFASFLARHPATHEVELVAPTSWSCAHGVGRWMRDCGCSMDGQGHRSQAWRTPLREGLNAARDALHAIYERDATPLLTDPWRARDAYGEIVFNNDELAREAFLARWMTAHPGPNEILRARELLEMERDTLRMFISCAWFFDDIGGLEPKQALRYAARALSLAGDSAALEARLVETLEFAKSNDPTVGTGADVYRALTAPPSPEARCAAAARALGARGLDVATHLPLSARAIVDGDDVTIVARRTGAQRRFHVRVRALGESDLVCDVTALGEPGGAVIPIPLRDFPERARHAIRDALRCALLPRYLTPEELDRLSTGASDLRGVVATALVRAIDRLRDDTSNETLSRANAVLNLFEQLETEIPFDAQTIFWQVWLDAPPTRRAELVLLGGRLGFSLADEGSL